MSCSFRINEHVHIGVSVRKTKGKDTVPYHNIPFKDAEIFSFDNGGFDLKHPNFTKDIWLEFEQLPLTELTIVNGIIKDELVFVESLIRSGGTQMILQKTDTPEYREYLEEHLEKKNSNKVIKLSKAKIGEVYIPAACKNSTPHIFLGIFYARNFELKQDYSYHRKHKYEVVLNTNRKRAFFLIEELNNKVSLVAYPISHKIVKELYLTGVSNENFTNSEENFTFLKQLADKEDKIGKDNIKNVRIKNKDKWGYFFLTYGRKYTLSENKINDETIYEIADKEFGKNKNVKIR